MKKERQLSDPEAKLNEEWRKVFANFLENGDQPKPVSVRELKQSQQSLGKKIIKPKD